GMIAPYDWSSVGEGPLPLLLLPTANRYNDCDYKNTYFFFLGAMIMTI
ncbi:MAG: hypothetical protein RLZZ290_81, partial [Pseudomonadota bacterium]